MCVQSPRRRIQHGMLFLGVLITIVGVVRVIMIRGGWPVAQVV